MPLLLLKDLPRYECILEAMNDFPDLRARTCEAFLNALRTADMLFERKRAFLRDKGISHGGFSVLMLLTHHCEGGVETAATLAEKAGVTRATMTGLIDTLVKDGLVTREPDVSDRRVVRVALTGEGQQLILGLFPSYMRFIAGMMGGLSIDEQTELTRLLQKLQSGMEARAISDSPPRD